MASSDPNRPSPQWDNTLASKLDPQSRKSRANTAGMEALLLALRQQQESIQQGGGPKAIEAQHAKSRLTARERLALLLDPGEEFLELGLFAAYGMYEEWGRAPGAGAVTGLGWVAGRLVMVIANDATVKAGAFFPMTAKKVLRPRQSPWRIEFRPFIWLILQEFFCPCKRMYFPTRTTLGASFATTR